MGLANFMDTTTEKEYIESMGIDIPEGWTTPPSLEDLKQNWDDSKSYHDSGVAKRDMHLDHLNITGKVKVKPRKGYSAAQPKTIRKHAEWRYAALSEAFLSVQDMFTLRPRTHADRLTKEQNTLLLNYQWNNEINKVRFVDEYVRATADEGTGFIRIGWESQEEEYEEDVPYYEFFPATTREQVMELQQLAINQERDKDAFDAVTPDHLKQALEVTIQENRPIYPVFKENVPTTKTRFIKNRPVLDMCNMANIYLDPTCEGDIDRAGFLIYSFETCKSDLKKEGLYSNLDKIQIVSDSILASGDHETTSDDSFNFKDEARAKFVAYEYWGFWDVDGSGTTTPIVMTWVGNTVIRMEENPYPDKKIPFESTQYLPVRKYAFGEPDGYLLRDNQAIIGAVTRGAIDIMGRSAAGQKGMRSDALDAINSIKFENGGDYKFNPNVNPRDAVIEHNYPELPNSVSVMLNWQETDANNMSGVRPFGATDSSAGTATADRGVLDAATKRETGILRRFGNTMQRIAKKIIAMNAEFLSDEEIVRITDDEFIAIRREDIGGSFDIEVNISTAEEDNAKAQELAFMLQTIGPNDDPAIRRMIQADIARLRKMPGLAKKIETFKPEPDPVAEKMKQIAVAKAELELAEIQAKTQKLQTAAQLDVAKASEVGTKSANIQADTDKKNLDFLSEQSGLNHAREVDKDKAQANGNIALEIIKADLAKDAVKTTT